MTAEFIAQFLCYLVVGAATVMYVILDGFDLGVGALHLLVQKDEHRRKFLNSIGPFWDGNEVWLIAIAGGLFAAFPDVYAVIFSGFYLLVMLMLCGIIFRGISIEFRSKLEEPFWRQSWDVVFWFSSLAITFFIGLLLGNLIKGVPVDHNREMYYSFSELFTPYPMMVGILSIFLFAMHGNQFLLMKTEGELQEKVRKWVPYTTTLFYAFFILTTIWTWMRFPFMLDNLQMYPFLWVLPILLVLCAIATPFFMSKERYGWSFIFSMLTIGFLFIVFGVGTYPFMVISTIDPINLSLTFMNAAAAYTTLKVVLVVVIIGLPLVFLYGSILYHIFRGKVELSDHSY